MSDIKPCPSCNGPNSVVKPAATAARPLAAGYYVQCSHCCACGPCASTPEESVEWWNKLPRRGDVPVAVAVDMDEVAKLWQEVAQLQGELEVSDTLHDKYVRAALTGMLAYSVNEMPNGNYHSNCSVEGCIQEARKYADAAMKARKT